jgi:hypothetical protein
MRFSGTESWSLSIDQWDELLECVLWFRAAERIEVPAGGLVTGPLDVDPGPEPSLASGEGLVEGWLWWWRSALATSAGPPDLAELARFGPPDFDGFAGFPALRDVVSARWDEANVWQSARKRAGIDAFLAVRGRRPGREGAIVAAVEAEIGHTAAPFSARIIVLPVHDREIRPVGQSTFLVPERVHASSAYDDWLRGLVRALA